MISPQCGLWWWATVCAPEFYWSRRDPSISLESNEGPEANVRLHLVAGTRMPAAESGRNTDGARQPIRIEINYQNLYYFQGKIKTKTQKNSSSQVVHLSYHQPSSDNWMSWKSTIPRKWRIVDLPQWHTRVPAIRCAHTHTHRRTHTETDRNTW